MNSTHRYLISFLLPALLLGAMTLAVSRVFVPFAWFFVIPFCVFGALVAIGLYGRVVLATPKLLSLSVKRDVDVQQHPAHPGGLQEVASDSSAVFTFREGKKWTRAELAHQAHVDVRNVDKAERGEPINPGDFKKIADALGKYPAQVLPDDQSIFTDAFVALRRERVFLTLEGSSRDVPMFREKNLVWRIFAALKKNGLLNATPRLVGVFPGSICIVADVAVEDARRIEKAFLSDELVYLGVLDVSFSVRCDWWINCASALLGIASTLGWFLDWPGGVVATGAMIGLALAAIGVIRARKTRDTS